MLELDHGPNLGLDLWPNLGLNLGPNLGLDLGPSLGFDLGPNLGLDLEHNLGLDLGPNLGLNLGPNIGLDLGPNLGLDLEPNLELDHGPRLILKLSNVNLPSSIYDFFSRKKREARRTNWNRYGFVVHIQHYVISPVVRCLGPVHRRHKTPRSLFLSLAATPAELENRNKHVDVKGMTNNRFLSVISHYDSYTRSLISIDLVWRYSLWLDIESNHIKSNTITTYRVDHNKKDWMGIPFQLLFCL